MILVSHFLNEVLDLADTVTVLRDGRVIRTGPPPRRRRPASSPAMLGRPAGRAYPDQAAPPRPTARSPSSIRGLSAPGVHDVSLDVRAGEIVGLAGLIGAGRTELARAIYGAAPTTAGEVTFGARPAGRQPGGVARRRASR